MTNFRDQKVRFNLRQAAREYRHYALFPIHKAGFRWVKNRNVAYSLIQQQDWPGYKTSDIIFLFCSGPSVNDLTREEWDIIKANDSFGLNYAFLTKFPMTFYYLGYEPSSNEILYHSFSKEIREIYENTLWFVPTKVVYRLTHPRTEPKFFPINPKLTLFEMPPAITFEDDRPFKSDDFQQSLLYRGSLGVGMHLIDLLGYKKIVLLGVDLHTYKHFYDDNEVMQEERTKAYKHVNDKSSFDDLLPQKTQKKRSMEEYYYALDELYFRPKGVQLYVGNKDNILCPRIPVFPDFK
ncbi:MAG: hypothetical protein OEV42_08570 [Deltaproteobacteria bacterium]|nr:hypothetical protein [Deltaproteobacteria bacterium]